MIKRHKKYCALSLIIVFVVSLSGCVDESSTDTIDVLVTIVPQKEMVEAIGGSFVSVTVMVPPGQSPHSFEPTPEQMTKVARATAYFIVGSGVEFELVYLGTILEQNSDLKVFDCSEEIEVLSFDEHFGQKDHYMDEEEHEQEDTESGTDPHVWTSPVNFKKMAEVVYNGLVEVDPKHQEDYFENYQKYTSQLERLHENISAMLQPFEGRSFMVYHPAWGYFGDTYNLRQIAIEDEGKQPGPAGVAALIQQAREFNISVIFVSPQFDTSNAQTIAEEIHGSVIAADSLMSEYQSTLLQLAEDMRKGFSQ